MEQALAVVKERAPAPAQVEVRVLVKEAALARVGGRVAALDLPCILKEDLMVSDQYMSNHRPLFRSGI